MRRQWVLASLAGSAALAGAAFVSLPSRSPAEPNKAAAAAAPSASAEQLPIGQVVLFSSGVGYFQREGNVEGSTRIDLTFPTQDINDLIKSLVLRDLDGGFVAAVSYESRDPVDKTLKSFAINLHDNPSYGGILNQARGERVEVALQQGAANQPGTLTGTIMGVEHQKQAVGKETVDVELLNLWCAEGMREVKLADVQRVRFLNPIIESEVKRALEVLAQSHDVQKKAVSLSFTGEGKRRVRVGYVVENPIWKTSYRLVLAKAQEEKPFLQGWAVVENPTDEDWKDVRMALVSGRPISFQMNLYDPLYVPRPVVEPELFASLRPVAYSGGMDNADRFGFLPPGAGPGGFGGPGKVGGGTGMASGMGAGMAGEKTAGLRRADREEEAMDAMKRSVRAPMAGPAPSEAALRLGEGMASTASAAKLGDFFQYAIDRPVSLPRQKSALLPIVNKDVEGTRVSIYNERTQAKFPLLGLKFKNTSGLHLMQGPITVFEGSNYAGDARILDLQPGEERLLSYAVDLGTEVNPVPSNDNGKLTSVKVVKGVLHSTTKLRESKSYTIKNRNEQERLVLLEHPVRHEFKLIDTDKPSETASDVYRFEVKVAPGKSETKTITEERLLNQQVQLTNFTDDQIRVFLNNTVSSPKVKAALQEALDLRWAVAKTTREIQEQERQLKTITDDQSRLRANLREMPPTAAAYKRYLEKFDKQETEIEQLQNAMKTLQATEHQQRKEYENFLANLTVE
jgi:hypothetical protein